MPMLGDILAEARRSSGDFLRWLAATDAELTERVGEAAERAGETPAGFVRAAVAEFSERASEEDWATLMSRLRDSEEPGTVCLLTMVRWRLPAAGSAGSRPPDEGKESHDAERA